MKPGQGSTLAEKEIELAISKITDWQGRPLSYERINAGMTNLNWKIFLEDEQTTYFMKVPGASTDLFIDREIAYEAAVKAAEVGCAPKVLYYLDEEQIEVHEFLEGYRSCNVADLMSQDIRQGIGEAYRKVHQLTLSRTLTGFEQLESRYRIACEHGVTLPEDFSHLLWQVDRAKRAIEAAGMEKVACFNDSHISNYMMNDSHQVKLIDWEYAYNNDPYWDLAMFSTEGFYNKDMVAELIEIHDGKYSNAVASRVYLYSAVMLITWSLWAMIQAKISTISIDFHKYAEFLLLKSRRLILNSEWEKALENV